MIFLVLAAACGATFRITRFVTHDRLTQGIRARATIKWHSSKRWAWVPYFLHCTWCVSVWVSAGVVLVLDRYATVPLPWAVALTASAVTGIVESHIPEE